MASSTGPGECTTSAPSLRGIGRQPDLVADEHTQIHWLDVYAIAVADGRMIGQPISIHRLAFAVAGERREDSPLTAMRHSPVEDQAIVGNQQIVASPFEATRLRPDEPANRERLCAGDRLVSAVGHRDREPAFRQAGSLAGFGPAKERPTSELTGVQELGRIAVMEIMQLVEPGLFMGIGVGNRELGNGGDLQHVVEPRHVETGQASRGLGLRGGLAGEGLAPAGRRPDPARLRRQVANVADPSSSAANTRRPSATGVCSPLAAGC